MAGAARVIGRVATGMTLGTLTVGALVINGEPVIERCITPGVRIMAVGALALEVIGRPCMARLAVRQPIVTEVHVLEVARVLMAACTGPREMVARRIVAGRTILPANVGMAEIGIMEIARILMTA